MSFSPTVVRADAVLPLETRNAGKETHDLVVLAILVLEDGTAWTWSTMRMLATHDHMPIIILGEQ